MFVKTYPMPRSVFLLTFLLFACKPQLRVPEMKFEMAATPDYDFHEKVMYGWGTDTIDDIACAMSRNRDSSLSVHINNVPVLIKGKVGAVTPESIHTFKYGGKLYLMIRLTRYVGCLVDEMNRVVIEVDSKRNWVLYKQEGVSISDVLDSLK